MTGQVVSYKTFATHIDLLDADVTIVRTGDNRTYFTVRHICRGLGLAIQPQLTALQSNETYREALQSFRILTPGGEQEMVCIRRPECAWWMANIAPKRCRAEVRDKLAEIQAQLMAEADRLAFGDLSAVLPAHALAIQPAPWGVVHFPCRRCGAAHRLVMRDGQVFIEIDTDEGDA